jgi:hypothetical protein
MAPPPGSDRWDRKALFQMGATLALLAAALGSFSSFVAAVERRPGATLADPVLAHLSPRDLNWLIFALVYAGLIAAAAALARHPQRLLAGAQAYAVMVAIRMAAMWLVPLDPPPGMILLRDPFVRLFGPGQILTRDLFFSGHTATLFLLFLAAPGRGLRALFLASAALVAASVLVQHVHYAIDVLAAPPFAYAAWRIVLQARAWLGLPQV